MDAKDFKMMVDNTKRFIAKDSVNGTMGYIRLEIDKRKGEITATAVDGYKVARECAEILQADVTFSCYIKPNIPKLTGIEYVEIETDGNRAYVIAGDNIVGYRQPDGEFPAASKYIEDALANESQAHVWINAKYLLDALQQIPIGPRSGRPIIRLDILNATAPVIIRHGEQNVKLVLPVSINID